MKKLLFLSLLIMAPLCASAHSKPQPEACPAVNELQAAGFSVVGKDCSTGQWIALQIDRYGRPESWEFGIGNIDATSKDEATQKAKTALTTLSGGDGPTYDPKYDTWACTYNVDSGYSALALTVGPVTKLRIC